MTVGRAERIAQQRGSVTNTAEDLRAQLHAANQRLITAAIDLHQERKECAEWQRLAAVRAQRITDLEQTVNRLRAEKE